MYKPLIMSNVYCIASHFVFQICIFSQVYDLLFLEKTQTKRNKNMGFAFLYSISYDEYSYYKHLNRQNLVFRIVIPSSKVFRTPNIFAF